MQRPRIPQRIARLDELAYNLWWSWNADARELFEALDPTLWDDSEHNAVKLLYEIPRQKLVRAAADPLFLKRYDAVMLRFDEAIEGESWATRERPEIASSA